jgi:hypothetical protein
MTTSIYAGSGVTPQIFYHRGDLGRTPTFTQTDFNVTHRYRFGRDDRFTLAADLNILNLLDQDTVTGLYPTLNTATGRPDAATLFASSPSASRQRLYANAYTSGALLQPTLNHINADPLNRVDKRYGMPQLFQGPRQVRFGFRMLF